MEASDEIVRVLVGMPVDTEFHIDTRVFIFVNVKLP
jgi:hypothetical protein